jgi:hypothetical protein
LIVLCACGLPSLSSTAQDSVIVLPATHDFGTIPLGQVSPVFGVEVAPGIGFQSDTVDAVTASCPDFSIDAQYLPADVYRICEVVTNTAPMPNCQSTTEQSYGFLTSFHPATLTQQQSCVVTIVIDGGSQNRTVTLTGTGMAPPIDIDVQPTAIQFGEVRIGTVSAASTVAVRDLGGQTLHVASVTVPAGFALLGPAVFDVAPGAAQNLDVTCAPPAATVLSGNLQIASNDPTTPIVDVPLACTGVTSNLGIAPSPAIVATRVGEPVMQTIVLTNAGGAATTVSELTLAGDGFTIVSAPATKFSLAPNGGNASVVVGFDAAIAGERSATLTIATDAGVRTAQITATAKIASMSVTPDGAVDFGPVCAGRSASQSFVVLGNADGGFVLQSISDPDPPFATTKPATPAPVAGSGGNQLAFDIVVAPDGPGPIASSVVIATDIPNAPPRSIALSATAVQAGVTATPAALDLGSQPLAEPTLGQAVQLTNCDAEPASFGGARIDGPDAADFAIVARPTETTIAPATSVQWLLVFAPHTRGLKQATFAVDTKDATQSVALTAEGLGPAPPDPAPIEPTSYYTCSTTRGAAAWPIVLALCAVRRRRSR